jgi:hypothetical protein
MNSAFDGDVATIKAQSPFFIAGANVHMKRCYNRAQSKNT